MEIRLFISPIAFEIISNILIIQTLFTKKTYEEIGRLRILMNILK